MIVRVGAGVGVAHPGQSVGVGVTQVGLWIGISWQVEAGAQLMGDEDTHLLTPLHPAMEYEVLVRQEL